MALFTAHPLAFQTAYSDLKRRALELPAFFVGTAGSVGTRAVKGRSFLYRQHYDAVGAKVADYIGPATDAASLAKAEALRERIAVTSALAAEGRVLGREGYVRADARTGAVLAAIANHALFRAGAVLVGSHAYGVLLNELGVRATAFLTQDVAIARGKPLRVAPEESFAEILEESRVPLHPVSGFDRKRSVTSYKAPGRDPFRVDLVVPTSGRVVTVAAVAELRAQAMALPALDYLLARPVDAVVLTREGAVAVKVPRPEVFAWHKMFVSQERTTTSDKSEKDLHQASVLVAALAEREPGALGDAFAELPKTTLSKVRRGVALVRAKLHVAGATRAIEVLDDLD